MIGSTFNVCSYFFGYTRAPTGYGRALGKGEKLMQEINEDGDLIVSSVIFVSSAKPLREENIKWSLRQLMLKHPLLRMRIASYNGEQYWNEIEKPIQPDLRIDLSRDWQTMFSRNTHERVDGDNGPMWHVTYMPNVESEYHDNSYQNQSAFAFGFGHAIIDGQARMLLMKDFRERLSESMHNLTGDVNTIEDVKSLKLPTAFDDVVTPRLGFMTRIVIYVISIPFVKQFLYNKLLKMFNSAADPFGKCVGLEGERNANAEQTTCVYPMTLNRDDTKLVLKACKINKVSVQSVIQAASVMAISEIIVEGAKKKEIKMADIPETSVSCTAALRNEFKPSYFQETSFVNVLLFGYNDKVILPDWVDPEQFWQHAHHVMKLLHSDTTSGIRMSMLFYNLMLNQPVKSPSNRFMLLSYTNLGNCNYVNSADESNVKITAHYSASGEHRSGPVMANCITTVDGKMFWGAVYYPHITSRDLAAKYLHRSIEILLDNCRTAVGQNIATN